MKHGFIKVSCATPDIRVADCEHNGKVIIELMKKASEDRVKILVLPELCITGYTCSDLFLQKKLLNGAKAELVKIERASKDLDLLTVVGLPIAYGPSLFNCAAVIYNGVILGIVPKSFIPNYNEFYEQRQFTEALNKNTEITINYKNYPFGTRLLFQCSELPELCLGVELCEDLWVPYHPSAAHAAAGATIIANLSASNEIIGKDSFRQNLVNSTSARLICAYLYADAGYGESTTDVVFAGHNIISENGVLLKEARLFENETITTEVDVYRLNSERRKITTYKFNDEGYETVYFSMPLYDTTLTRTIEKHPFIPNDLGDRKRRCETILNIQCSGLLKRLCHSNSKSAVVGVSGGLDSCLALLVAARTMDMAKRSRTDIVAVTMPCFGTTSRTRNNAEVLARALKVTLRQIDITGSVINHFKDIGHDIENRNVVYENAQARERTQVLMDIANQTGGLVIGTGDLSEAALGFSTYNGDHMSMYGINSSVPKTLIRHIIQYVADTCGDSNLSEVLKDILDTPVSPELLPSEDGEISQKTEELVGPYELHDFFLYYAIRWGFIPEKVFRLCHYAFRGEYSGETIKKWLISFYKRFFSQQFKRSCMPDGPKVGSVSLSPRGDFRMPSDAVADLWISEAENINPSLF